MISRTSAVLGLLFAAGLAACAPAAAPAGRTEREAPPPSPAILSEAAVHASGAAAPTVAVRSGNPNMKVIYATSPLVPGREAVLRLTAPAGAQCQIAIYQGTTRMEHEGLATVVANSEGEAAWTWTVPGNAGDAAQNADGVVICTTADGQISTTSLIFPAQTD